VRYFLITDHNRDGEHEYYDKVAIETKMTVKEFNSNKDFWQECFLAWQFGYVNQEGDDWWSDCRIVDVYDTQQITKEEFIVLDKFIGGFSLESIIEMGQNDWMPSDENLEHYGLEVACA